MRPSQLPPTYGRASSGGGDYYSGQEPQEADGTIVMRNIASFLTLSDAASLASDLIFEESTPATDSWAVGEELDESASWSVETPITPALVAVSPGATPYAEQYLQELDYRELIVDHDDENFDNEYYMQELLHERRRQWAQEKLAAAIFSHPRSLRTFCWEAYAAAKDIRERQQLLQRHRDDPETLVEPMGSRKRRRTEKPKHIRLVHELIDFLFYNVPLSVLFDVMEAVSETSLDTTLATFRITVKSIHGIVGALGHIVRAVWDGVTNFNPLALLEAIISLQFNAMGKTSEALVSGIQSVATGVGSASSMALHRLSVANLSANRNTSAPSLAGNDNRSRRTTNSGLNKKLLKKLSSLNAAARVVAYTEIEDDTGGLNNYARSRVQRMLHYDVSLRPFVATVSKNGTVTTNVREGAVLTSPAFVEDSLMDAPSTPPATDFDNVLPWNDASSSSGSPVGSSFMCTPQSFPPTPNARSIVLARGHRFSDDVVFLARDRLRIHDGLHSTNERTREMARLLREGKSLAVFDAKDATTNGIELTCGQHIAAKVGVMLYCSTHSMVPVLRNCFVYFEMLVIPRPVAHVAPQPPSMATLSIGLSTGEMPPNTLVGAWQGSVGLCSNGQILMAGQWCSPVGAAVTSYTDSSTVGCLVCLDDDSAFETWDGVMVTAAVIFSVNGVVVSPPVSTLSATGRPGSLSSASSVQRGLMDAQMGKESIESKKVEPVLPLLVPAAEDLYPTVTLHSPATAVMCRFSAQDVTAPSRESIGAPSGVTVYAVDGSVLFDEQLDP